MKIHPLVPGIIGAALVVAAYNRRSLVPICCNIFKNTIAKGAGVGFTCGLVTTGVLVLNKLYSPPQGGSEAGMTGAFAERATILFGPSIIGTVFGALVGIALSLSKRVTIQLK